MSFHPGDRVFVNKEIIRIEGLYANKGETGVITEIFYSGIDINDRRPNAKVQINGKIKTFRLTSITKIEDNQ